MVVLNGCVRTSGLRYTQNELIHKDNFLLLDYGLKVLLFFFQHGFKK